MAQQRRKWPWVLLGVGVAGGILGIAATAKADEPPTDDGEEPPPPPEEDEVAYLSGLIAPRATLGAAPQVISDLQFPITLSGIEIRTAEGDIVPVMSATFTPGSDPNIDRLVTNLTGRGALELYEIALAGLGQGKQPADAAVAALRTLRPKIDWQGLTPTQSAEELVLNGAVLLAVIGEQSLANKAYGGPHEAGDVVVQGTEGNVQWRVVLAYVPGDPRSPRPAYGPSETRDVYDSEFLDPGADINQWMQFGWGKYSIPDAIEQAEELAVRRPWA